MRGLRLQTLMVYFKTETVDVSLPEGQFDVQPTVTRTVHIQPVSAQAAFDQFNVAIDNAFLLMDETSAQALYAVHGRVYWGDREYAVQADPKVWNHGLPTDHIEVLIKDVRSLSESNITVLPR